MQLIRSRTHGGGSLVWFWFCMALFAGLGHAGNRKDSSAAPSSSKPNILFLFNDDQDLLLGSLNYLDSVTKRIQPKAFTFNNHYATIALCCPARVALLRGQQAHNTNITDVAAPGGGYDKFRLSKQDEDYLPHWLKRAGYHTEYLGKLMNQYGYYNYETSPKGWDHFDGLLDPYTYIYNVPVFSQNGARPVVYEKQHQTDVMRAKAASRLKALLSNSTQPWFLEVAAVAPHQQFNGSGIFPPVPLSRHASLYPNLTAPRTPNFNPKVQKKPSWVGELPLMNETMIAFSDATYRGRAQALQGINEMFHDLLDILEDAGELDNTIIIFSSDHGYHVGQHRVPAGKTLPYREDSHVPLMIRGPGIPEGKSTNLPSTHIDIAPTLLTFAGLENSSWPPFLDGRDLSPYWASENASKALIPAPETVNIEFWGLGLIEDLTGLANEAPGNSYKTLRIVGENYGYLYSHWCTGESELYDTIADPYELSPLDLNENAQLYNRLDAVLLVTKSCELDSCRNPWRTLHPAGDVNNLAEALSSQYDSYYASFPKVAFKTCLAYQLDTNEAPFYPPGLVEFGERYRDKSATDGLATSVSGGALVAQTGEYGAVYEGIDKVLASARELTDAELGRTTTAARTLRERKAFGAQNDGSRCEAERSVAGVAHGAI